MSEAQNKLKELKDEVEAKLNSLKKDFKKDVENTKVIATRKLSEVRAELEAMAYDAEEVIEEKLKKIGPRIEEAKAHYQDLEDHIEAQYKGFLGWFRKLWRKWFG